MAHRAAEARLDDAQAQPRAALTGPVELHRELHAHLLDREPPVAARAVPLSLRQFRSYRVNGLCETDRFRLVARQVSSPTGGPGWRDVRDTVLEPGFFAYADALLDRAKEWEARRGREAGMVDAESLRHAAAATVDLIARRDAITVMADPVERLGALRELAGELRAAYPGGEGHG